MVESLADMEPVEGYSPDRRLSEAADQFNMLSATNPSWLEPHRRRLVLEMPDRFPAGFDALCLLLAELDVGTVEDLAARAAASGAFFDWWLLAAVDSVPARQIAADAARAAGKVGALHDLGVEVGPTGPALWRFTTRRFAMFADPSADRARHRWEPPARSVAADAQIRWGYCTVDVTAIPSMPAWRPGVAHMVGASRSPLWVAQAAVDHEGRLVDVTVVGDDEDDDEYTERIASGRAEIEGSERALTARLQPFDERLVYCNGHVELTPELLGVVGGPPLELYGSPDCRSCGRLMFHVATTADRRYDEGFRSLYICDGCTVVATVAKSWN